VLTKYLGRENLELFFRAAPKVFGGLCNIQTMRATGKTQDRRLWHRTVWDLIHDTEEKNRA